ncbi:MAG: hypothetical protein JXR68_12735, partial [Bacteroidales bacterium]|nr:hypothetical protein [Bacteroidales bacterium]
MKNLILNITVFVVFVGFANAQTVLNFNSLDSLLNYAELNSISIKTGEQQTLLAKWQKISATSNIVNLRNQVSATFNNNLNLPVTYLPAEVFGGVPGTYKEVTMGQQFVGTLSVSPQIDII